jgi:hypothetical protein
MVCCLDSGERILPELSKSFRVAPKVIWRTLARYSTIKVGSTANVSVPFGLGLDGDATKLSIILVIVGGLFQEL